MSFFENDPAAGGARHKGSKHNVGHETGDRGKKEPGKRRNAHIRCDPKENFVSNGRAAHFAASLCGIACAMREADFSAILLFNVVVASIRGCAAALRFWPAPRHGLQQLWHANERN